MKQHQYLDHFRVAINGCLVKSCVAKLWGNVCMKAIASITYHISVSSRWSFPGRQPAAPVIIMAQVYLEGGGTIGSPPPPRIAIIRCNRYAPELIVQCNTFLTVAEVGLDLPNFFMKV
jgi:hypothetical protein